MADDAVQLPWDEQTDIFVNEMDVDVAKKYKLSLRELLLHPEKFAKVDNMAATLGKIKTEVSAYFEDMLGDMKGEDDELTKAMEAIDAVHTQINQTISSRAGIARVPFLRPVDLDTGDVNPETIYIDRYDGQVDILITKLINSSNYVCDLSTSYRKYSIGSWLFSGSRSCVLSVQPPESMVVTVEDSRDMIIGMLDDISDRFFGA